MRHFSNFTIGPQALVARQSSTMPNLASLHPATAASTTHRFSSSGSDSSDSSTSVTVKNNSALHRRNSEGPRTLQSLVRTKCWSIAPLWKFVTYELETAPIKPQPQQHPQKPQKPQVLNRSASFRPKKQQKQVSPFLRYILSFYFLVFTNVFLPF